VSPNFKQKIATLTLGENNNYTVPSGGGVLFGTPILSTAGSRSININGNPVAQATNGVGSDHICVEVQEDDVISCSIALASPNYIYAGLNVFEKL